MKSLKINKSITNRDSQSINKYLQEITKEELIDADQEVILARKIKE
jgi:RNA polymerase primary sigma factor